MLVVRYERPLFRFLGLLGFGPSTVEDLAQETFLRAYRALGEFDASRAQFSTWLFEQRWVQVAFVYGGFGVAIFNLVRFVVGILVASVQLGGTK